MNHGLLFKPIEKGEYIFGGASKLDNIVLREDRDWRGFIPLHQEVQNLNGIEPYACTNFGTANTIETLLKHNFGIDTDFSDRWYAKASGTSLERRGNDPHSVAEFARLSGLIEEPQWTFDSWVDTPEKFYLDFPKEFWTVAVKFIAEFDFKHEWVPSDPNALYDALQFSPLGFSTYAWLKGDNGLYYRPDGSMDNHWVECISARKGEYWEVLDSYRDGDTLFKKIAWDSLPMRAKRYQVKRQTDTTSIGWLKFKAYIKSVWPF